MNNWLKLNKTLNSDVLFVIAALQDDVTWCSELLEEETSTWLPPSSRYAHEEGQAGKNILDPTGAPISFFDLLPRDYFWALSRAWGAVSDCSDRERRAMEFGTFLESAKNGERLVWASLRSR